MTIWVVRHGDDLFIRSYRGPDGGWYRASQARHEGRVEAGGVEKAVAFADVGHGVEPRSTPPTARSTGGSAGLSTRWSAPGTQATAIRLVPRGDGE